MDDDVKAKLDEWAVPYDCEMVTAFREGEELYRVVAVHNGKKYEWEK